MKNSYVQAVTQLIASGREVELVLSRAKTVMEARGHGRLYAEVLREVVTVLETEAVATAPKVTLAKAEDASNPEVAKALAMLDCADIKPVIVVDSTIIGGVTAKRGHTHIDMSYKTTLQKLYQAITTY